MALSWPKQLSSHTQTRVYQQPNLHNKTVATIHNPTMDNNSIPSITVGDPATDVAIHSQPQRGENNSPTTEEVNTQRMETAIHGPKQGNSANSTHKFPNGTTGHLSQSQTKGKPTSVEFNNPPTSQQQNTRENIPDCCVRIPACA